MDNKILDRKRLITSIIFKAVSLIASVYGLMFTIDSIMSFTFFTTLSNVALDIVLVVFIVLDMILLVTGKDYKNNRLYMLKFLMTLSITLTCLVYMIILGPTSDDFLIFDTGFKARKIYAIYAVIPPLCYVGFVYILAVLGVRWYDTMTAPYNFLNYNVPTGWFGWDLSQMGSESLGIGVVYMIVVLLLIFIGIGLLYLTINGAGKSIETQNTELVSE